MDICHFQPFNAMYAVKRTDHPHEDLITTAYYAISFIRLDVTARH